jgi:hypothetical protein
MKAKLISMFWKALPFIFVFVGVGGGRPCNCIEPLPRLLGL